MPPKPGEKKRTRVSSSEEEKSSHVLVDDAILKDLQAKCIGSNQRAVNQNWKWYKHSQEKGRSIRRWIELHKQRTSWNERKAGGEGRERQA